MFRTIGLKVHCRTFSALLVALGLGLLPLGVNPAPPVTMPTPMGQTNVSVSASSSAASITDPSSQSSEPISAAKPKYNPRPRSKPTVKAANMASAPNGPPADTTLLPLKPGLRPLTEAEVETFSDSLIRTVMTRDHIVGVSVAIVHGDQLLWLKGYGYDRLEPARPVDPQQTLFRLGSVSKVMTWIVARQEIETGRIALNAPLNTYLPQDGYAHG